MFVGRALELAELRSALEDAVSGRGSLFVVSGEPGIGKTRLADEVSAYARELGVHAIWGRCWEGGGTQAYWPWVQVIRSCVGDAGSERIEALLNSEAPQVADLLPEITRTRASSGAVRPRSLPSADAEAARLGLFDSAARLLKTVAGAEPLLVVLDDLQEADQSSLLMFRFIARELKEARVLLLGTFREGEVRASPALSRLIGEIAREGHQIALRGLSETEVAHFVEERLETAAESAFVDQLMRATAGNPLFLDGVIRMLLAENKVAYAERLSAHDFTIPDGVREAIRQRLTFLSKESMATLAIAAVAGQEFEFECLRRVAGGSPESVIEALNEARRDGLLYSVLGQNFHYRFAHDLIRETIYQDIPAADCLRIHRQVGETLEQIHRADLIPHLAKLADHYRQAAPLGEWAKAIEYSIRAGEAALTVFAYEEAANHWRAALSLMEQNDGDNARRADLLRQLGVLVRDTIDYSEGVSLLETALRLCKQVGDDHLTALTHLELGSAGNRLGSGLSLPLAMAHYREAEKLMADREDLQSIATLYVGIASVACDALQTGDGLTAAQRAMTMCEQCGDWTLWSAAAAQRARNLMVQGRHTEARSLLVRVERIAVELSDLKAKTMTLFLAAWYYLLMRVPLEARRLFLLGTDRSGPSTSQRSYNFEFLALTEHLAGNQREAQDIIQRNKVNLSFRARIAYREGDWAAAQQMLLDFLDSSQKAGIPWVLCDTFGHLLETFRMIGEYDKASAVLPKVLTTYGPNDLFWEVRIRPSAALLAIDTGHLAEAASHLECCRRILAQGEDWLGWAGPVVRAEAGFAAAEGRFDDANAHFAKSVEVFRRYSLAWDEADTLHYWGQALIGAGDKSRAIEKLDAAVELYRHHGAGQIWTDRVMADRRRVLATHAPAASTGDSSGGGVFRKEGDYWTVFFSGEVCRLKDAKGLHYLVQLLRNPGVEFSTVDLASLQSSGSAMVDRRLGSTELEGAGAESQSDLGDAGPILDGFAKADYRRRIAEVREELDEAERLNDVGRRERLCVELDLLTSELTAAVGLHGIDRKSGSHVERARSAVSKRIRFSISEIAKANPTLGKHLSRSVQTGYKCAYVPQSAINWTF